MADFSIIMLMLSKVKGAQRITRTLKGFFRSLMGESRNKLKYH